MLVLALRECTMVRAIVSAEYSPTLGFIHTWEQLPSVHDVADLYKTRTMIADAFRAVCPSLVGPGPVSSAGS